MPSPHPCPPRRCTRQPHGPGFAGACSSPTHGRSLAEDEDPGAQDQAVRCTVTGRFQDASLLGQESEAVGREEQVGTRSRKTVDGAQSAEDREPKFASGRHQVPPPPWPGSGGPGGLLPSLWCESVPRYDVRRPACPRNKSKAALSYAWRRCRRNGADCTSPIHHGPLAGLEPGGTARGTHHGVHSALFASAALSF